MTALTIYRGHRSLVSREAQSCVDLIKRKPGVILRYDVNSSASLDWGWNSLNRPLSSGIYALRPAGQSRGGRNERQSAYYIRHPNTHGFWPGGGHRKGRRLRRHGSRRGRGVRVQLSDLQVNRQATTASGHWRCNYYLVSSVQMTVIFMCLTVLLSDFPLAASERATGTLVVLESYSTASQFPFLP